ncbi:sugar ABC transporter [Paenibacillus darwinianus]|uniref:Sugar ABC transporter n=1 Tax=Paenibacillus darwinianus TaxID=1380763 RepID=A0A9W5RZ83_9BACL|nr:sugar ABC transporter ATP-binding protein [Paenibacillus darwinianus]EXX85735.1 sugar ABC transporter [Paenibacillus darwinianus]EXX85802.1 sugar ABC transporter [Paenibacillus darwinianus]
MSHLLEMRKISKQFNDNTVLNGIDFVADGGQVHAIIGENGAGKSTMMRILAGLFLPDSGEIRINGDAVSIQNPKQSQELGIAMIHQEMRLFQDLTITENVFMRREPLKRVKWIRLIDWDSAYKEAQTYLDDLNLPLDSRMLVKNLTIAQQKFVEIIKALSQDAKIIIMDEPTAALTEKETELLFQVIRDVKKRGVCIIYISHRIEELRHIADVVTVLRDGEIIEKCDMRFADISELVRAMAGKELSDRYPKLKVKLGKEILRVEGLSYEGRIRDISFDVRRGEILGITGLSGSGRSTLAKVLFGIHQPFQGTIWLGGKPFFSMNPHLAQKNGLCYVTGVSHDEGLILDASIAENITLSNLERISSAGFIRKEKQSVYSKDLIERLGITADEHDLVKNLSGGKQKKVILAKWLFSNAKVLLMEEPTAGIDIVSKIDIYNIMNELVLSGVSIIMISTNIQEIIGLSDRIVVMYKGEIRGIFPKGEATQERILYYASGGE